MSGNSLQLVDQTEFDASDVGRAFAEERARKRAAQLAGLRKLKADSLATLLSARPKAEAQVAQAEQRQRDAQQAAEDALGDYIAARERLDAVVQTHQATLDQIHPQMRALADPRIGALRAEMKALRDSADGLYRSVADGKGRVTDNAAAIARRRRRIDEALDALGRLEIAHDVEDVGPELDSLRSSIPEA